MGKKLKDMTQLIFGDYITRVHVGNMIPEIQGKENNISTGKPINSNNRNILSSTEFLAGLQCDSQLVALAKLGTLFILTGVGTWYVVKALPVVYQGKSQIQEL